MRIGVIGLGMAGLPFACIAAEKGFHVVGVDVDERRCRKINKGVNPIPEEPKLAELIVKHGGKNLVATSNYQDAKDCSYYVVIVPLFIDEKHRPDFISLKNAFTNLGKILKKDDCVVLETTVPPGTTETMVRGWLETASGLRLGEFYLAHSPERIMTGFSISRLKEFPKVIGGVNKESGQKAYDVYQRFIGNLTLVSSARVAEFVKVIEGCYRNTNIALANELFKIADELHIDFYEARSAAHHRFCDIHLPSTGVGGHCIPVYPWFLINEMERKNKIENSLLLRTAHLINEEMIEFWAVRIVEECMKIDKPINEVKICIQGITFRKGVKSLYNSRNLALVKHLMEKKLNVFVYDELLSKEEIADLGLKSIKPDVADLVFDCFALEMKK